MPDFSYNPQNFIDQGLGTIFGIALGGYNDQRQYDQQKRLQELQIEGQKEMTQFNMAQQFDMWNKTNYGAQVEHLKNAGLNPALLYGMKGGGGITTGNASGSVTGAQAPQGGKEIQEAVGMGIQMRLLQAQEENIRADTELKKADATKTAGVDTEKVTGEIELLAQGLTNLREDYQIKRLQQTMMNIENFEKQATQEDRLEQIQQATKMAMRQVQITQNTLDISDATIQDQIKIIQQHAIGASIQNEAMQNNIKLTQAQVQKIAQEIVASQKQLTLQELETIFKTNFPNIGQTVGRVFNDAIEAIFKLTAGQRTPHNTPNK